MDYVDFTWQKVRNLMKSFWKDMIAAWSKRGDKKSTNVHIWQKKGTEKAKKDVIKKPSKKNKKVHKGEK